jgi:outer membrane receptor protein involved in Fe transport
MNQHLSPAKSRIVNVNKRLTNRNEADFCRRLAHDRAPCEQRRVWSDIVKKLAAVQLVLAGSLASTSAWSQSKLDEVIIFGRAEALIGIADAASEGTVGGDDLLVRPMLRTAELLEAVPGLIAAQHSGSGKANQYFLRGFQLDHGTDFTAYIDDVPWNLRTHGHGQGYLDVNGLIPEVIDRVNYRKGTYRADVGDFSMAGSALMTTIDRLDRSFIAAETGSYDWLRFATGGTADVGDGAVTLLGQYKTYNGPWELEEDLQHGAIWGKYAANTGYGSMNVTLSGYIATWKPTEQTPESAFGTDNCADEYCSLDKSADGKTERWILGAQWFADNWRATAYAQYYNWHMLSNATYEPDGQIKQFDRRAVFGGRFEYTIVQNDAFDIKVGAETRYDDIGTVGFDSTVDGEFVNNISDNNVKEGSVAGYAEATWKATDKLRVTGALRADYYDFDVKANESSGEDGLDNVGDTNDSIVSPKVGIAYAISDAVELYGNWGQGFHSNDARGVNKDEDPVPGLVDGTGYEVGARFEVGAFKITGTYWWLDLSSELIFVGDDNTVEPKGGSERRGYEVVVFWRPIQWLGIDAVYTGSRARYTDDQMEDEFGNLIPGTRYVEGGVEHAGELGIAAIKDAWELSARLRYLGEYALLPDNSERADNEYQFNVRAAYNFTHLTVYGELLNAFDHKGKDIVYFYENAFDPEGGRVSRAEEPRTVRVGLKYRF